MLFSTRGDSGLSTGYDGSKGRVCSDVFQVQLKVSTTKGRTHLDSVHPGLRPTNEP